MPKSPNVVEFVYMKKAYLIVIIAIIIIALVILLTAKTAGQKEIDNSIPDNLAISNEF